jgi:hypothetical protein
VIDPTSCPILERYFESVPDELKRIGSVHSSFEAEMDARECRRPHALRVIVERDEFGGERRHVYGGLVNGQVYCGQGDELRIRDPHPKTWRDPGLVAAGFAKRVELAFRDLEQNDVAVLRLRFREPLPAAWVCFGIAGANGRRDRPSIDGIAVVARELPRGCGNVAHLTEAAQAAHAQARTQRDLVRWLDALGSKADRGKLSPAESALVREIRRQAEALVSRALARFLRAFPRVPEQVRRRAAAA